MNFDLKSLDLAAAAAQPCDALLVLVPAAFKPGKDGFAALVGQALKAGDLDSKAGKLLALYRPAQARCGRAVLVGAGDGSPRQVRLAVNAALGALRSGTPAVKKLVLSFAMAPQAGAVRAAVQTVADNSYVYTTTKSKPEGRSLARVTLAVPKAADCKSEFSQAAAAVAGIELAKEWANRPANHATPTHLAQAARALARLPKVSCQVLGPREVAKLGMGAFMAVAQGSEQPLRFIVLHYQGAPKSQAPTVLVGKGITFDTGGISIKPAGEMDEMKFDMSGAASVLGVFRSLGELKPAINVVGLIPSCENMPDGRAIKPGDVVTSMSGQTIEILNTDAEGRLILCDALTYAERYKPQAVVDIATLTGACVIALGRRAQRPVQSQRRTGPAAAPGRRGRAGPVLAHAAGRGLCRGPEEQFCRRGQCGRPRGRRHHRGQVPAALYREVPLGTPGHRRHGLEERGCQGCHRPSGRPAAGVPAGPAGGPHAWQTHRPQGLRPISPASP